MTTTLANTITMPVKATKEEADKAFADMVYCTIGAALISIEHKSILMNFICVSVFLQQKMVLAFVFLIVLKRAQKLCLLL